MKISISIFLEYLEILKISRIKGRGTELITFSFPKTITLDNLMGRLRSQKNEVKNVKSKRTKKAIELALDSIIGYLLKNNRESLSYLFTTGIIEDKFFFRVFKTENILPYRYYCSDRFRIEDYTTGLSFLRYYLLSLDLNGATVASKETSGTRILKKFDSYIPSKTKKGGQSSRRYAEIRVNETRELFSRVASYCNDLFQKEKRVFLIGGSSPTIDKFVNDKYLLKEIKDTFKGPYYLQNEEEAAIEELLLLSRDSELEDNRELQINLLSKRNYGTNDIKSNSIILVPNTIISDKLVEIFTSFPSTCEVVIIDSENPKGAEFNYQGKIRIIN